MNTNLNDELRLLIGHYGYNVVLRHLKEFQVSKSAQHPFTYEERLQQVDELIKRGKTRREIADELDLSETRIMQLMQGLQSIARREGQP